jgi:hypothetical protein
MAKNSLETEVETLTHLSGRAVAWLLDLSPRSVRDISPDDLPSNGGTFSIKDVLMIWHVRRLNDIVDYCISHPDFLREDPAPRRRRRKA